MAKKKKPIMVDTRRGPIAIDTIMEIVRIRLLRAARERHLVAWDQWRCVDCAAENAGLPSRTLLAISDSDKPLVVSTHTHCPTCGKFYPRGEGT